MKKIISIVLSLMMLLSMSVTAFAAESPAQSNSTAYYNETEYISAEDMVVPINSEEPALLSGR